MKKIAIVLASVLVASCASSPKTNTSQAPQTQQEPQASASNTATSAVATTTTASNAEMELRKLNGEIQQLDNQSDYFDYDKYVVKAEYLDVLKKEADFIKAHKNDVVKLEGNADERGGEKYNLNLGKHRAEAVARSLEMQGVPASQINLVSFGKDQPRLQCHEEKCWKENRRVDFVHKLG